MILAILAAIFLVSHLWTSGRDTIGFDPSRPFRIDFGRGSGMDGLDTVSVFEDGRGTLSRRNHVGGYWERANVRLTSAQLGTLADAIVRNGVTKLRKEYHSGAHDGTQWVLWIRQNGREKACYFDNKFPAAITAFSRELDRILSGIDSKKTVWVNVGSERPHEKELWDSIRR